MPTLRDKDMRERIEREVAAGGETPVLDALLQVYDGAYMRRHPQLGCGWSYRVEHACDALEQLMESKDV